MGGRVPAPLIVGPHRPRLHARRAQQGVDQRRLPHARGADQGHGGPRRQVGGEGVEIGAAEGADDVHGHAGQIAADGLGGPVGIRVLIRLVQRHHRLRPGGPEGGDVALDAPRVEVAIQATDQDHGVHVGGDGLTGARLAGGGPAEDRAPGQGGDDEGLLVLAGLIGIDDHPVADGGVIFRIEASAHTPRHDGPPRGGRAVDGPLAPVHGGDPSGAEIGAAQPLKLSVKARAPAQRTQDRGVVSVVAQCRGSQPAE